MKSLLKTALLGILAFVLGVCLQETFLPVDFLYLFIVVTILRWGMTGGLVSGAFAGFLASFTSTGPWARSVFVYALLAYFAALVIDRLSDRSLKHNIWSAGLLALFYSLVTSALASSSGIGFLAAWNPELFLLHLVVLTGILTIASRTEITGDSQADFFSRRIAR